MSRFVIQNGKKVKVVKVGVNQNGLYHKRSCRFYVNCEEILTEDEAIAAGYICGQCCLNKEN